MAKSLQHNMIDTSIEWKLFCSLCHHQRMFVSTVQPKHWSAWSLQTQTRRQIHHHKQSTHLYHPAEREVALATHCVFVNSPNDQLHTLQKVSWLSNTQAVASVSNHWPPGPQVLDTKASLVSSGKASHGHWMRAVSMWSVCGQWKVMLSDLIACSTERQGRAERRARGEQHYGHHLSRLANHIQINNLLTLKSRIKQMIPYS